MTFRKDINGLRAIAILAVILFHFKIKGFTGGFAGVDIFFVISGYLMTAIIFTRIRGEKFSLVDFYISRAKRIIPALAVLCTILMVLGFVYLEPIEYRELLRCIKSSIFFTSNLYFSHKTGYFATPMQENWLLHTWSLSVEWQFYIIYPIVITLLCRFFNENVVKTLLLIVAAFSLIGASIYVHENPTATFYLLPTRAWEMIAGGIVFLFPLTLGNKTRSTFELSGLFLVIFSILYFSEGGDWPSYRTLVPVIGTMMILYGNRDSIITGNIIAQFIGKVSYSAYLWHWPIAVFLYYSGSLDNPTYIVTGIATTFILATISYYCAEQFFLKRKNTRRIAIIKYLSVVIILGGIVSPTIASYVKKHYYTDETVKTNQIIRKNCSPPSDDDFIDCKYGEGQPQAIIIGDSHTDAISETMRHVNPEQTIVWARHGCPTLEDFHFKSKSETAYCHKLNSKIFNQLATQYPNVPLFIINRASLYPDPIDLGGHFARFDGINNYDRQKYLETYRKAYLNTVCKLTKQRPVYIIKPIPEMRTDVVKSLKMQKHFTSHVLDITLPIKQYYDRQAFILKIMDEAKEQCGIKLLDPTLFLCPDGKLCIGSINGESIYNDDNHLNNRGSALLFPLFTPLFKK
ncbi:acyltransferase [Entomomonas moraniae]|uniref:Acyltransferase n=1 Tax=Entomomonas moraniae TaxID=2213226 RepID=A0A3Q9JM41_9GAMM|nr:acyltransferase family protein [Entomomonas moraniae]AZS50338.1 acyltransferase [Entomomonas moraniae]